MNLRVVGQHDFPPAGFRTHLFRVVVKALFLLEIKDKDCPTLGSSRNGWSVQPPACARSRRSDDCARAPTRPLRCPSAGIGCLTPSFFTKEGNGAQGPDLVRAENEFLERSTPIFSTHPPLKIWVQNGSSANCVSILTLL